MSEPTRYYAFTTKSNGGLLSRLSNEVIIIDGDKSLKTLALWDTGATSTCISYEVVSSLSLVPTGKMKIQTPSGSSQVNTYLVDIVLPNNVIIRNVQVCDSEIGKQGIGVLVGMNIILRGDFSISNYNGNTVFSFRIPSKKTTDYVQEINIENVRGPVHGKGKRKK